MVLCQSSLISWKKESAELNFFFSPNTTVCQVSIHQMLKNYIAIIQYRYAINEFSEFSSWNIFMTHWHTFGFVKAHNAGKIVCTYTKLIWLCDCKSCRPIINVYSMHGLNSLHISYYMNPLREHDAQIFGNIRSILLLLLRRCRLYILPFKANFCLFVLWKKGKKHFHCSYIAYRIYYHHWIQQWFHFRLSY